MLSPISTIQPGEPSPPEALNLHVRAIASDQERIWLRVMSVAAIAMFLLLAIGLLTTQRKAALDMAKAQAHREVKRLAAELEESLRVARASMDVVLRSPERAPDEALGDHTRLVSSLNLPFSLRQTQTAAPVKPAGHWLPSLAREDVDQWVIPLTWQHTPEKGGQTFEVLLDREALLGRFASEGMSAGGSMSLFRVEDDGATTVLARYPLIDRDQGRTMRGHVSTALQQAPSGVMQVVAVFDGVHRVVGYQRLNEGAERLVMVYALPVDGVLAAWTALLPLAIALTLLITAAMAYGAWRLDRAILQMRRSERHFQTLTGHLPDVILRYDHTGRVLYANPAVEQANGFKPEAMLGRTLEQIGTPLEVVGQWSACLERVFRSGVPESLCFTLAGPRGQRHWEAHVSREPVLAGEHPTALVINRDITERHEAESRRLSAQQLFETVFRSAPEAMSLTEWHTGRILLVNDAYCELFGRHREQLIGRTTIELNLWRSPSNRQQLIERLERSEQVRHAAVSSSRADGAQIHVRYSAERVQQDGKQCLLMMFRDVTQLESEQRALEHSELRFRLAAAHGQVWEWDFDGGFIQPSNEFLIALGHTAPSAKPMEPMFLNLLHPEDVPRLRAVLRRFLKGEDNYQLEFRARDANGQYRWFDTRGSGLREASGRVTYMAGTTFDITDRKALEEAQRQTLAQLETVANASPALIWTSGGDKQADWFNGAWLAFTGRGLEQVVNEGWLKGVHPDDQAQCMNTYFKAFEAHKPFSMEHRLRHYSGEYRWLLAQGRPRFDADNRFIGFICSCLDLTELRAAEDTARERGVLLEQVFDVLQDMLFVVDEHERFVHYQVGRKDMLYAPPEDFLGRVIADVMPPEPTALLRDALARARTQGLQEVEYSLALPDGMHTLSTRIAWLPESRRCMFVVRDVTERRAAQIESERLSKFVFLLFGLANRFINLPVQQADPAIREALGDIGKFLRADRTYLFEYDFLAETASNTHEWCAEGVSPEIENLQNLSFELMPEWVGSHRQGHEVHVPDVQALPSGRLRDLLESQGIRSLIALPLTHGGRCMGFVGLDTVRSIHDYGEDETTLLLLFAQMLVNIHLRVEAESHIRDLTEGLERKVVERTAQLEASMQQLKAVNRELESFTYSASHDLRTPLRGIEGFSSLLLHEYSEQLDDQGREYLKRIQRATIHMSTLVNDLLTYSRMQHVTDHIEPVDLATAVQSVAAPFHDEIEARGGQLQVSMCDGVAVRANPQGLAIVLRNLIDNALKFTPAGKAPQIRVEALALDERVLLSVIDHGIGFDMKYHDRIFGMFQRLHRQEQIPGTGIGLALVLKAVERMGGRIRAESTVGEGARFEIDLPSA
ncbi:MAG: PAS domain S-box protein [Hydrogenophaga sp.]